MSPNLIIQRPVLFVSVCYFFVGTALYVNTLESPFIFDDHHVIADLEVADAWQRCLQPQRIVAHFSFFLNLYLFGPEVRSFRTFNILIHIATAIALFLLLRDLLRLHEPRHSTDNRPPMAPIWVAALSAGIFLAHPVATQSVTYICQRYTSLATLLMVSSLGAYVRARLGCDENAHFRARSHIGWYVSAILLATGAMFTKEFPIALPLLVLVLECFLLPDQQQKLRRRLAYATPMLLTGCIVPILYVGPLAHAAQIEHVGSGEFAMTLPHWAPENISRTTYLYTQLEIIWHTYLKLLIFPLGQSFDHDFALRDRFVAPTVLGPLFGLTCLAAAAIAVRRSRPFLAIGFFWFLITLAPTSSFVPSKILVAEHRLYPALAALSLAIAEGLRQVRGRRTAITVMALVLATLSLLTIQRNTIWNDALLLWKDASMKAPERDRPYLMAGDIYFERGKMIDAVDQYERFIERNQNFSEGYIRLGMAYAKLERYAEALAALHQALKVNPENPNVYKNLITVYRATQEATSDTVVQLFTQLIALQPDVAMNYAQLAYVYVAREDWSAAARWFAEADRIKPRKARTLANLAAAYRRLGDPVRAESLYLKAAAVGNVFEEATVRYNLGELLVEEGRVAEAIRHYERATEINAGAAKSHVALARLYAEMGDRDAARTHAERAMQLGTMPDEQLLKDLKIQSSPDGP